MTTSWIYKYPPDPEPTDTVVEAMKCPLCKSSTEVLRTVTQGKDYLRRRECYNGHRFTTREVLAEDDPPLPRVSTNAPDAPTP